MSRWKVWREWPIPSETPDAWEPWCAWDGEQRDSERFFTHAEAMDYADRMARTREVVLPRNHGMNKVLLATADGEVFVNYESDDYLVLDHYMKGPKPLGLALLALAEQEQA